MNTESQTIVSEVVPSTNEVTPPDVSTSARVARLVAEIVTSDKFNRSKAATAVMERLEKEYNIPKSRGISSMVYNAVDAKFKDLLDKCKLTPLNSVKSARVNSEMEIEETLRVFSRIDQKLSLSRQTSIAFELLSNKVAKFIQKPTLGKRKAISRINTIMNGLLFQLNASENPEDVTYAKATAEKAGKLLEAVRNIAL